VHSSTELNDEKETGLLGFEEDRLRKYESAVTNLPRADKSIVRQVLREGLPEYTCADLLRDPQTKAELLETRSRHEILRDDYP